MVASAVEMEYIFPDIFQEDMFKYYTLGVPSHHNGQNEWDNVNTSSNLMIYTWPSMIKCVTYISLITPLINHFEIGKDKWV